MIEQKNERAWKLIHSTEHAAYVESEPNRVRVSRYGDGGVEFGDLPERIEALYVRIDELENALRRIATELAWREK